MSQETMQKLQEHDEQFRKVGKRFDQVDVQIDFLVKKVLEHDERLERIEENMATKADIRDINNTLDVLVKLAQKKDQELTFMGNRVSRIEDDVKKIKPLVGLAS